MQEISELLNELQRRDDCIIDPPAGGPDLPEGVLLPEDLNLFYDFCGGARFTNPGIAIVAPSRFLPINEVVLGERFLEDPSAHWYLLAESDTSGTAERISIDLRPDYLGRCYNSFWDRHGVAGSMDVVARSFGSFLSRLSSAGRPYWSLPGYESLGDAYDVRMSS